LSKVSMQVMKKTLFGAILILAQGLCSSLTSAEYYFYVQLTDKLNSPFNLQHPEAYLSYRSLARRAAFQIPIDSADLPVNPHYIEQLRQTGVSIHSRLKWLNGVTIVTTDSGQIRQISAFPFVSFVQYTGIKGIPSTAPARTKWESQTNDYGAALSQLQQVNGHLLHENGATGQGILIGVLDAGFKNADTNPAFSQLWSSGRLTGHISIIDPAINVFNENSHGAAVLSVMGGHLPGEYKGTAPDASYLLIQTEYVPSEYLFEVDFWVRGIEYADSAGVDVINSSLGYTEFDDPGMNYRYEDMNGRVSRASRAAEIAARKGIIVCNSAGNSGTQTWKFLGAPGDAKGILTVGSVDKNGNPSGFSSYGPSSDGRVKPEISARGTGTSLISTTGSVTTSNGTSFSSPLMAGLAACHLQLIKNQNKTRTIEQIIQAIIETASVYPASHPQLGYGIPDFSKLPDLIPALSNESPYEGREYTYHFDKNSRTFLLTVNTEVKNFSIFNISGQRIFNQPTVSSSQRIDLQFAPVGLYIVEVKTQRGTYTHKITLY
jgi:serine protease AprX